MDLNLPSVRPYAAKLVDRIPLSYGLTLIIFWELIYLFDYLLSFSIPGGHEHIAEHGGILLFFAAVTIAIVYCSRVLSNLYPDLMLFIDHDNDALRGWYEGRLKMCYEGAWPVLFGIAFAAVEEWTIGPTIRSYTPDHAALQALRTGYRAMGFFFLGTGLWALINVITIPLQLTKFKVRVTLSQLSGRGLQALGESFFKMSLAIAVSFIIVVGTVYISPISGNRTVLAWEALGALMIFGFFLLPQIGVHRIMAFEKQQRLISFAGHLETALEKSLKEPSSENMQRLKELFELQQHLRNMNEWPFNVNALWQLISALLIPLLLASLEIIF